MAVKRLLMIRIVSTVLCLTVSTIHEYAVSLSSYTFPYVLAIFFSDTTSKTRALGLFIVGSFLVYALMLLITPLLLRSRKAIAAVAGLVIAAILSVSDIVCCVVSFVAIQTVAKAINMLFSICIIILSCVQIRQLLSGHDD